MTTLYHIEARHPVVPGYHSTVVFSEEARDAYCMKQLAMIASDIDFDWGGRQPPAETWQTTKFAMQAILYSQHEGGSVADVFAEYLDKPEDLDFIVDNSTYGFSIRVEEHNVPIPANIPGRLPEKLLIWTASADDKNGTRAAVCATEEEAQDQILRWIDQDRETMEQWIKDNPDGLDQYTPGDFFGFVTDNTDYLATYNVESDEIASADLFGKLPIPDIAIILEGGMVQNVCSRDGQPVRVTVVDYDTEGADDNELTAIPQDDGKDEPAILSQGGFSHDTSATEVFWQALVGDPHTQPQFRTVWTSTIIFTDMEAEPRVSCFRSQADRLADLRDFASEQYEDIEPDEMSEGQIIDALLSQCNDVANAFVQRTAIAEG